MYDDIYGSTEKAENLMRPTGIIVRLMVGKLDFRGQLILDDNESINSSKPMAINNFDSIRFIHSIGISWFRT